MLGVRDSIQHRIWAREPPLGSREVPRAEVVEASLRIAFFAGELFAHNIWTARVCFAPITSEGPPCRSDWYLFSERQIVVRPLASPGDIRHQPCATQVIRRQVTRAGVAR